MFLEPFRAPNEGRSKNYPKRTTSIKAVRMNPCCLFLVQESVRFHCAGPTLGNRGPSVSGFPRVDRADVTTSIIREYGVRRNQ